MQGARWLILFVTAVVLAAGIGLTGCVNVEAPDVDAPDEVNIGSPRGRQPIDTSRLPATRSHEEARQRLAEAYERIDYLEDKVRDLEDDKRELKDERDEYKHKYKREKKRHDD